MAFFSSSKGVFNRIFRRIDSALNFILLSRFLAIKVSLLFPFRKTARSHTLPAPLIVSLTSYPARFPTLHLTLKCLLSQSISPDLVILWIAHEDEKLLTPDINNLKSAGLTISFCDNLLSFKKIIPTLERYEESYIVTADDDVYYGPSWLEKLVVVSLANSKDVVCHRSRTIRLGLKNLPLPYNEWGLNSGKTGVSPLTFQTGLGGVLYPPNVFHSDVLDIVLFTELCPHADDVWLFWMIRMNKAVVRCVDGHFRECPWPGTQTTALWRRNSAKHGNDGQIERMLTHYGDTIFENVSS
ncbi:MAG: hypothetical protein ACJASY_002815 [Halioglobus sp.]|jgi:hypothetical protein